MSGFVKPAKLTADLIEAFAGMYLSPRYDAPSPTPDLHRKGWELYTSDHPQCEFIAPREHAKSTALTFAYIMAECCFRTADYTILIGSTEDMAAEQLSNIREEIEGNADLHRDFGIADFEQDSKTDIIVRCDDGHRFRVLARGAEQKIRGKMWKGKRPNLMVADDMEDDEQVENKDRRAKFRRWFFRAARQALSKYGKIRVHGTILHEDSLLARLLKCPRCKVMTQMDTRAPCPKCGSGKTWQHLFFKAHRSFDDFSDLLWPEQWPEERLRARQQEFIEDNDAAGYSQEFLNDPQDNAEAYLRRQDFLPMSADDRARPKRKIAAADFAVSKADMANRTCFSVGGICPQNLLHIIDVRVGRWDPLEWIDEMFSIEKAHHPEIFFVEDGVIWKTVSRMVFNEMQRRNSWINIEAVPSVKDKATRGRVFQKRMRAGGVRFDQDAEWYPGHEAELLRFTGSSQATLDDQFDAVSLLAAGAERLGDQEKEDYMDEEELEMEFASRRRFGRGAPIAHDGRSRVTGY
jgi:predicted phage terminase large subunit-like protein